MAPAVRRHLHVVLAPSSAECGARLPQISRLELARKPKAPWLLKWSRGHCDVTTAWPLDNSTMPPLILQLRVLLRAFSSSSPRQAFLTLYSSLIYPFCFVHFMIFSFPGRVYRLNHTLPRQPSASLHQPFFRPHPTHPFRFAPLCSLTFHLRASSYCDGHCTISHTYFRPLGTIYLFIHSGIYEA